MSATKVAIAVVESAGQILVGVRPAGTPLAGKSEFPGGKCQTDETPRSCVVRECREETGLVVVPREHLATVTHQYDHDQVELHFWRCVLAPDLPDRATLACPSSQYHGYESQFGLRVTAGVGQFSASGAHAKEAENCRANSTGVWSPSELCGRR